MDLDARSRSYAFTARCENKCEEGAILFLKACDVLLIWLSGQYDIHNLTCQNKNKSDLQMTG